MSALCAMQKLTDAAEVVRYLSMMAERRGMNLPSPSLLALDAKAIAAAMPDDLWPVACARLWTNFAYRRLPEPSDFLAAVADELAERRDAAARIHTAHLKVRHLRWLIERRRECDAQHAAIKARERALYPVANATNAANATNVNRGLEASAGDDLRSLVRLESRVNPPGDRNLSTANSLCDRNIGVNARYKSVSRHGTAARRGDPAPLPKQSPAIQEVDAVRGPGFHDGSSSAKSVGLFVPTLPDDLLEGARIGAASGGGLADAKVGGDGLGPLLERETAADLGSLSISQLALTRAPGIIALQGSPKGGLADAEFFGSVPDRHACANQTVSAQNIVVGQSPRASGAAIGYGAPDNTGEPVTLPCPTDDDDHWLIACQSRHQSWHRTLQGIQQQVGWQCNTDYHSLSHDKPPLPSCTRTGQGSTTMSHYNISSGTSIVYSVYVILVDCACGSGDRDGAGSNDTTLGIGSSHSPAFREDFGAHKLRNFNTSTPSGARHPTAFRRNRRDGPSHRRKRMPSGRSGSGCGCPDGPALRLTKGYAIEHGATLRFPREDRHHCPFRLGTPALFVRIACYRRWTDYLGGKPRSNPFQHGILNGVLISSEHSARHRCDGYCVFGPCQGTHGDLAQGPHEAPGDGRTST
jgi:hypothetical protein